MDERRFVFEGLRCLEGLVGGLAFGGVRDLVGAEFSVELWRFFWVWVIRWERTVWWDLYWWIRDVRVESRVLMKTKHLWI